MATIERDVESALTRAVRRAGGMCVKFLPDFVKGFPDRLVLLPGGRVVFVETKRPDGGRVDEIQKLRQAQLRKLGFDARIIHTREEVASFAREIDSDDII